MFGFGTSAVATIALIVGAPMAVCVLLYILVRLEPPLRRPLWLTGADPAAAPDEPRETNSESAA